MDLATVHTMYEALAGPGPCFLYSGPFHDGLTARLIDLGGTVLDEEDASRSHRGRLAFVMVEAYQNIVRHRADLPDDLAHGLGRSLFIMRAIQGGHEVVAMNALPAAEEQALRDLLHRLGGMDGRQLKELFLAGLQAGQRTGRGGAGLGLIEMARRSSNGLHHRLVEIGPGHRLFTLQVAVDGDPGAMLTPATTAAVHAWVAREDIQLCCIGRLGPGLQQALLSIISADPQEGPVHGHARQRAWLAASGLLDSLPTIGDPLMLLGGKAATRTLVLGLPLPPAEVEALTDLVDAYGRLDDNALRSRYRDVLLGRDDASGTSSLGVLEVLRQASAPLRQLRRELIGNNMLYLEVPI